MDTWLHGNSSKLTLTNSLVNVEAAESGIEAHNFGSFEYARIPEGLRVQTCAPNFDTWRRGGALECDVNTIKTISLNHEEPSCPGNQPYSLLNCITSLQFDSSVEHLHWRPPTQIMHFGQQTWDTGHCINATEELHNLWLDARHTITAKEFMHCAEVSWLRQSTIRHHNRLAARVARKFNLNVRFMTDISAVGPPIDMLLPTTCTIHKDLHLQHNTVYVTNDAALFAVSKSGVIFDCWANEGFWVFNGPRDTSSYKIFGTNFKNTNTALAFPCKTVRYNSQYQTRERNCFVPVEVEKRKHTLCSTQDNTQVCIYSKTCRKYMGFMFPHSVFVEDLQKLGFSLNDGITNLMPIVTYCSDE